MNVLIVFAGRHGSTHQIADVIADELQAYGYGVQVHDARDSWDGRPYDAAVIGSAVYMGRWLADAGDFIHRQRATLAGVPVWLFSSGPLDSSSPQPSVDPPRVDEFIEATGARDHRIFAGKLDKNRLGLGERLAVRMVNAPEGDYRDWEAIRRWAREIADSLSTMDHIQTPGEARVRVLSEPRSRDHR